MAWLQSYACYPIQLKEITPHKPACSAPTGLL